MMQYWYLPLGLFSCFHVNSCLKMFIQHVCVFSSSFFLLLFLIDQSSIQISGKEKIILKLKICCAKQNAVPSSGTGPKLDWSPCSNQGFTDHYWPSVCVCVQWPTSICTSLLSRYWMMKESWEDPWAWTAVRVRRRESKRTTTAGPDMSRTVL